MVYTKGVARKIAMMRRIGVLAIGMTVMLWIPVLRAENIDPCDDNSQYAYGENIGWVNFEYRIPEAIESGGATVTDYNLTGYIWTENVGWINLDPNFGGVMNDGTGLLSGYAWGENIGWIDFNPKVSGDPYHYGVTIDHEGNFEGWAWGENIGWIHFQSVAPIPYKVQTSWITTCQVNLDDLFRFVQYWLATEGDLPGDLDNSGKVDLLDYAELANLWLELCPTGWPLK